MTVLSAIITPTNIVTASNTLTLTNKTINGTNNTITNVNLATGVTGTLPAANGGTGLTSPGANGNVLTSNGSAWVSSAPSGGVTTISFGTTGLTPSTATAGAVSVAGTLAVANGGTGQTSYTNGQLLIGNTTGNTLAKSTLTQGTGISISNGAGSITVTNSGVTSITGTADQITASASTGGVTLSTPQSIGTSSSVQFGSFGVGTSASGTTGEIRATNNVTAYYSSDIKFKENVRDIPNPLSTVNAIGGKLFDWKEDYIAERGGEDGYFVQKNDFGVIAQDVLKVFPLAVRTRGDGSLAVDYEKLAALAFAAIRELTARVEALEAK